MLEKQMNKAKIMNRMAYGAIILMAMMLITPLISGLDWDNRKSYDAINQEVSITNAFGLGNRIATIKLLTPHDNPVMPGKDRLVAEVNMNIDKGSLPYNSAFKDMKFYNIKENNQQINRQFTYKYKYQSGTKEIPIYRNVCTKKVLANGTIDLCSDVIEGYRIVPVYSWETIDMKSDLSDLPNNNVNIGIFTDVNAGDKIEWIPTWFGVRITEYAVWTSSLDVNLLAYYKLNETSGVNALDSVTGIFNGTSTAATFQTGIIGGAYNLSSGSKIELPAQMYDGKSLTLSFWIYSRNESIGTYLWKNSNGDFPENQIWAAGGGTIGIYNFRGYDGSTQFAFTDNIVLNTWVHYVLQWTNDGTGNATLWRNGIVIGADNSVVLTSNATTANTFSQATTAGQDMRFDEIGWWNRYLTPSEITDLYNGGLGITYSSGSFPPVITQNSPADALSSASRAITFNCTANDNLDMINLSLIINNQNNLTITNSIHPGNLSFNLVNNMPDGKYNWSCTGSNNKSEFTQTGNRTLTIDATAPAITMNQPTGNYYAPRLTFPINFSVVETNLDTCWYSYNNKPNVTLASCANATANFTSVGLQTINIYANDTLGNVVNLSKNFAYYPIMSLCNATVTNTFLNISFGDESTNAAIMANVSASSWTYYSYDNSAYGGTYGFTNTTGALNYALCFAPNFTSLNISNSFTYGGSNYPSRVWELNSTKYTNASITQKKLYLLSTVNGIYQPIIVTDGNGGPLNGAVVSASNVLVGFVDERTTDSNGQVSLWLDPNIAHTITTTKTGYPTDTRTINPSATTVYITLGSPASINENASTNYMEGVSYTINPQNQSLENNTAYNFQFVLHPGYFNIDVFNFTLYNSTGDVVAFVSASSNGGTITSNYNVGNDSQIRMVAHWISEDNLLTTGKIWAIYNTEDTGFSVFFFANRLKTYIQSGMFGLKTGFGLNLICFVIILLTTGIISYKYGFNNPIIISLIATILTAILELGLGLITMGHRIPLTFWAAIITIGMIIREGLK